jgi:hypothetical protein
MVVEVFVCFLAAVMTFEIRKKCCRVYFQQKGRRIIVIECIWSLKRSGLGTIGIATFIVRLPPNTFRFRSILRGSCILGEFDI